MTRWFRRLEACATIEEALDASGGATPVLHGACAGTAIVGAIELGGELIDLDSRRLLRASKDLHEQVEALRRLVRRALGVRDAH